MPENVTNYLSFICITLLLFFAVLHLNYKNRTKLNVLSAFLFLSICLMAFNVWLFITGAIFYVPWMLYSDLTATFFIGPVIYFLISELSSDKSKLTLKTGYHFIPAGLCFIFFIVYNLSHPEIIDFYRQNPSPCPNYNLNAVITVISIIADTLVIVYFVIGLKNIILFLKNKKSRFSKEMRFIFFLFLFLAINRCFLFLAHGLQNDNMFVYIIFISCLGGIIYFMFSIRNPEFAHKVIKDARRIRYENMIPDAIDVQLVLGRLSELMKKDHVFKDDEISLLILSDMLKITPHQLSRIINREIKMNFRSYINSHRIEESKKLLLSEPDMSILEVAFSTGFNSKPTFNSSFLKMTGMTPSEFRENPGK